MVPQVFSELLVYTVFNLNDARAMSLLLQIGADLMTPEYCKRVKGWHEMLNKKLNLPLDPTYAYAWVPFDNPFESIARAEREQNTTAKEDLASFPNLATERDFTPKGQICQPPGWLDDVD